jgi:hemolysin activation/secretion protein
VPTAEADIQIEEAKGAEVQPGQSDLVISYKQALPFRLSMFADDSGSKATGKYQGGITLSYDNALTLNDLFYVSLNTDLGGGEAGGRGTRGTRRITRCPSATGCWAPRPATTATQAVAGINQTYVYRGTSSNMPKSSCRAWSTAMPPQDHLSAPAFQRRSNNFIDDTEVEVQRRVVGGWELSAGHRNSSGRPRWTCNVAYKRGTGAFGSLPAPEEPLVKGHPLCRDPRWTPT